MDGLRRGENCHNPRALLTGAKRQDLTGIRLNRPEIHPFSVHLLTASGALWAFMAAYAVLRGDWVAMFAWLGLALLVDGVDGPLARKLNVSEVLPRWSGHTLDLVIDYATYVFVPAMALVGAGLAPGFLGVALAGVIVVTGALYFADEQMKTDDRSFQGFPGAWNMVVLVLFVVGPPAWLTAIIVVAFALLTFLPINFVHPVRTPTLRPLNILVVLAWMCLAGIAVYNDLAPKDWVKWTLLGASLYLCVISGVFQIWRRWRDGR